MTLTLPPVAVGHAYHIRNHHPYYISNLSNAHPSRPSLRLKPNGSDKFLINTAGAVGTDGKYIQNSSGSGGFNDYVKVSYGSTDGWIITELGGTWTDES